MCLGEKKGKKGKKKKRKGKRKRKEREKRKRKERGKNMGALLKVLGPHGGRDFWVPTSF